jgi:Tfp pilus assembly protein FimT
MPCGEGNFTANRSRSLPKKKNRSSKTGRGSTTRVSGSQLRSAECSTPLGNLPAFSDFRVLYQRACIWYGLSKLQRVMKRTNIASGFTTVELAAVVAIAVILMASAIPSMWSAVQSYRAAGDARGIASQLALTRMRAASDFTQAQLTINTTAGTYQVQVCTAKGTSSCTTFTTEGGTQYLSYGTSFGYGSITAANYDCQNMISQASTILFNSRGIPINSSNTPTDYAIYLTDGNNHFFAVSACASGGISVWQYTGASWSRL